MYVKGWLGFFAALSIVLFFLWSFEADKRQQAEQAFRWMEQRMFMYRRLYDDYRLRWDIRK